MTPDNQYRRKSARDSLSKLLAGIDRDIKRIFLKLPPRPLTKVFLQYGAIYGISKVIYAKNTYPKWQSGEVAMSGMVVARLLNLVPLVMEPQDRYELVKKLRSAYVRREYYEVWCDTTNWFKKVPPVVEGLVDYSNRFTFPVEVIEKLKWLSNGDGRAAQELLAAIEVDEATARTQYLNKEYGVIKRMLESTSGTAQVTHTIELPQGTVQVTITKPKLSILDRVPIIPTPLTANKRKLTILCKNPRCRAELETNLTVYDGEPIDCKAGSVTCPHCNASFLYAENDLRRTRVNLNVELRKRLFGGYVINYDCPLCGTRLNSPVADVGKPEACPNCRTEYIVPAANLQ